MNSYYSLNWAIRLMEKLSLSYQSDNDSNFQLLNDPSHSTDDVDIDSECPLQFLSEFEAHVPEQEAPKKKNKKRLRKKNNEEEEECGEDVADEDDEMKKIKTKFKQGCDCEDSNCFEDLDPRSVYRHRLNITELTKAEHDMYLMGLIKACISCNQTSKNKERQRLRAHYFYQGRKVCLTAFLFLENCTRYQLKRIRCHLMSHGVTPRVHGNQGKRPHNVFSLETYNQASEFLKKFFEQYAAGSGYGRTPLTISSDKSTRKHIHALYMKQFAPKGASKDNDNHTNDRLMGYTTFLYFIKHQFPHVKFVKQESFACKTGKEINRDKLIKQTPASSELAASTMVKVPNSNNPIQTAVIENNPAQEYEVILPQTSSHLDSQLLNSNELLESHQLLENHLDRHTLVDTGGTTQLVMSSDVLESQSLGSKQLVFTTPSTGTKEFSSDNSTFIMTPTYTLTNQPLLYIQIQ
ncbi:hypothetical protein M8J77_009724 [Diaphorina citri]|nr:hypothetical protein M8J77_009724 [Diaphorina citri]